MQMLTALHFQKGYAGFVRRKIIFISALAATAIVVACLSLSLGSYHLTVAEVYAVLWQILSNGLNAEDVRQVVVVTLRLPRVIMAVLAGFGLGVAGAVFQGILRNPLASPTTIGTSAAAGLGAALAITMTTGMGGSRYLLVGSAFIFSMLPSLVIFGMARVKGATSEMMILAGIGMLYIFSALTSLLQFVASENALKTMVVWLMGELGRAKWPEIGTTCGVLALCLPVLVYKTWDLNVMGTGDETAKSLGIHPDRDRVVLLMTASFITAAIICFTGMIGFIGLVAPHICRLIIGNDHRYLLPASGFFGAVFLVLADALARWVIAPVIIPVGIITGCAGGPLFLYLIMSRTRRHW